MENVRPFQIPQDLDNMLQLINDGFQYPENPDWNIQEDEKESMLDSIRSIRRIWPLIQFLQTFVPFLRDIMRGFIYEVDSKPVGLINFGRHKNIPDWFIGNITVLPEYRRRGIARKLVEESLAELRNRHAEIAHLEVIAENLPAYRLYENLGFEAYSSSSDYEIQLDKPIQTIQSKSATIIKLNRHDWKTHMEFAQRITPSKIQYYEPIKKNRSQIPLVITLIGPLLQAISGSKTIQFAIVNENKTCAEGVYTYRTKEGGVNTARVHVDPNYPELAPVAINHILASVQSVSPRHRLEIHLKTWQPALLQAAEEAGCTKRYSFFQMATRFD